MRAINFLFPLLLLVASPAISGQLNGKVVGISDGDTLTLLDDHQVQHKIRLAGIDAPEKKQAFGDKSKQALSDCAFDKRANVDYDKTDKYGRTIGKVLVSGRDCNLRQIELGLAWHYKKYAAEQPPADRENYANQETSARSSRLGLWGDPSPVPPWDYRKLKKN
jgi:endonuclease YncB( thermonuclease family)